MLEVSKDLGTIETRTGGRGGGRVHAHTRSPAPDLEVRRGQGKDSAVTVQACEGPRRVLRRHRHQGQQPRHARGQQGPQDEPAAPGGGRDGGRGGHAHTEVTGTELANVTAAVKAKDSAITIQRVQKDPDGSYDVIGTKDNNPVMLEVSKDLKTIQPRTGGPGGGQPAPSPSSSSTSTT